MLDKQESRCRDRLSFFICVKQKETKYLKFSILGIPNYFNSRTTNEENSVLYFYHVIFF